jgi:hypothetical protein
MAYPCFGNFSGGITGIFLYLVEEFDDLASIGV